MINCHLCNKQIDEAFVNKDGEYNVCPLRKPCEPQSPAELINLAWPNPPDDDDDDDWKVIQTKPLPELVA